MHKQLLERRGVGRGRGRVSGSLTGFETVAAYADVHTMDGRTRRHGSPPESSCVVVEISAVWALQSGEQRHECLLSE
ncbi:hypothetical protein J6590_094977 [Homalodisca vitripennis]|nr:hypothetical protein J6590_094977 [Homalodisca vitripennis]